MNIKQQIIDEIELLANAKIEDNDEIIFGKERLLDSINVLHILLFIEMNFGITVDTNELSIENFNTVNKIVGYIEGKIDG